MKNDPRSLPNAKCKLPIACLCLILLIGCDRTPERDDLLSGKVTRVVSGQTVEVMLVQTNEVARVRITGIDAPDLRQSPWGKIAKDKLSDLVMDREVELERENATGDGLSRDRFNRINAHVWQNNTLVSQRLVKAGFVLANTQYPHSYSKLLINAQEYARLMGFQIWNRDRAMRYTPSQFRSKIKPTIKQ